MYLRVSIHASSREDATCTIRHLQSITSFNPRVLAGGRDTSHDIINISLISVSIHASSREDATSQINRIGTAKKFQSTRPRGRTRPAELQQRDADLCFNPRVLAGGRDIRSMRLPKVLLFQSTRPRGRTRPSAASLNSANAKFQSTRPRGRTRLFSSPMNVRIISFNPRVLAGGRDKSNQTAHYPNWFQSTRPRGRTRP